jgi:hypothetical protein
MMEGRHPTDALRGIAREDMSHAERRIADHFGLKADTVSDLQKIADYQEQRCAKIAAVLAGAASGGGVDTGTGYNFHDLRGQGPTDKPAEEPVKKLTQEEIDELEEELETEEEQELLDADKSDLVMGMAKIAQNMKVYAEKGGPGSGPHPGGGKARDATARANAATRATRGEGSTRENHATAAQAHQTAANAHSNAAYAQGYLPAQAQEHLDQEMVHLDQADKHWKAVDEFDRAAIEGNKVFKYSDAQPREGAGKWAEQTALESVADKASGDAESKSNSAREAQDGTSKSRNHINAAVAHQDAAEAHARAGNIDKAREHASRAMAHYSQAGKLDDAGLLVKMEAVEGFQNAYAAKGGPGSGRKFHVVRLDRLGGEQEAIRSNVSEKEGKQIQQDAHRLYGHKTKLVPASE